MRPNPTAVKMNAAELEKIHAEIGKLMAETGKLNAETTKLNTEALKMRLERAWYPMILVTGAFTAGAALAKLLIS